ncbi:MAG: DUF1028 domain-containing protein [Xanthobacteraceae bacterium]
MTFSIVARCKRTGQLGTAVATSTLSVGSRVPQARARTGALIVQYWADQRLARRGIDLMSSGCSASETLDAMLASTPHRQRRQIAVIDAVGRTAGFNGSFVRPHHAIVEGDNCVAAGNILANAAVILAMVKAFEQNDNANLADRLLFSLQAGADAGGEPKPLLSSALMIVDELDFAYADLRIDRSDNPVTDLRRLWNEYGPRASEYILRVTDPDSLP